MSERVKDELRRLQAKIDRDLYVPYPHIIKYDEILEIREFAIHFIINGREMWMSKSKIEYDEDIKEIIMPDYIAKDNGL